MDVSIDHRDGNEQVPPAARGAVKAPPRDRPAWQVLPVFLVAGVVIPLISSGSGLFVWTTTVIWVLFALATNVLFGWSGMLSFGQAAYLGTGAYTVALLHGSGLSPPLLVLAGGVMAAVFALVFSAMALRTSGVEFAVLTLVFAQVLWLLTFRVVELRGVDGFGRLAGGRALGVDLGDDTNRFLYVLAVVALSAWALRRLQQSSLGAALGAVRDDPLRAAAIGLPVRRLQMTSFAVAGGFSGIAGGLLAQHQGVVTPSLLFWVISGQVIVACLIGGMRWFWGPALGALVVIWANHLLFGRTSSPTLYIGFVLLLIVLVLPGGLSSLGSAVAAGRFGRRRRTSRGRPPADPAPAPVAETDAVPIERPSSGRDIEAPVAIGNVNGEERA